MAKATRRKSREGIAKAPHRSKDGKGNSQHIGERAILGFLVFVIIAAAIAIYYSASMLFGDKTHDNGADLSSGKKSSSRMSLTSFDLKLALEFMDKNKDGKCDSCGMPVEMCTSSGQLQCNMDPESTIGVLGSQHLHADWAVYINGKKVDLFDKAHMERMKTNLPVSSFIHVDSGNALPEKTGDVLHMHATGVPLWIFFESIDLKLPNEMKAYANGKEISDYKDYVFNDLDKLLLTDGTGDLKGQLNSITNFAEKH